MNRSFLAMMRPPAAIVLLAALAACCFAESAARVASNASGLQTVDGVPVLVCEGTPDEIGRRIAGELGPRIHGTLRLPGRIFRSGSAYSWDHFVETGRRLRPNLPPAHRDELAAVARYSGIDGDVLAAVNVMMDAYRGLACSALVIEPAKSTTGGPIFGRNLDFFGGTELAKSTVVFVYRQKGKHAFATVGFAGLSGCLSGMNDAGLAIAVHEVLLSADESTLFNPEGVPYTFAFRRILEECKTIDDAAELLRSIERTTKLNLSICDSHGAAALEITPKSVEIRRAVEGVLVCTNHFRTPKLVYFPFCSRYGVLSGSRQMSRLGVGDVYAKLGEAAMGGLTLQTMVFEPKARRIHVAFGSCPATELPLRTVDLSEVFE